MENGYIKLWRKTKDSRVFRNEGLLKVWIWCLLKASHKKRWYTMKTGKSEIEIELLPGQFVYGRLSAAESLNMKPSTVRNRMGKLEKMQNLAVKKDSQYSIVTIMKWDDYQPKKLKKDSKEDNQRTAKGQSKDTDKNVENEENVNNKDLLLNYLMEKIESENLKPYMIKIGQFYKYRQTQKIKNKKQPYKSEQGINGLFRDMILSKEKWIDLNTCLDIAMEKEWLTPDVTYFKEEYFKNKSQYKNPTEEELMS